MDIKEAALRPATQRSRHPWEMARAAVVQRLLHGANQDSAVVLDFGCGDCFVIQQLASSYPQWRFVGMDSALMPDMIENLRAETGIPHLEIYESLDGAPRTGPRADIVLLLDVLEHVERPGDLLRQIADADLVSPDAIYLITVPAFQPLFCYHDRFLEHFRRYNRRDLAALVAGVGLSVRRIGYFFTGLLLPRLVEVGLEKTLLWSPRTTGVVRWKGHGQLDVALSRLLLLDFMVTNTAQRCGVTLPGLTCFAICQK